MRRNLSILRPIRCTSFNWGVTITPQPVHHPYFWFWEQNQTLFVASARMPRPCVSHVLGMPWSSGLQWYSCQNPSVTVIWDSPSSSLRFLREVESGVFPHSHQQIVLGWTCPTWVVLSLCCGEGGDTTLNTSKAATYNYISWVLINVFLPFRFSFYKLVNICNNR